MSKQELIGQYNSIPSVVHISTHGGCNRKCTTCNAKWATNPENILQMETIKSISYACSDYKDNIMIRFGKKEEFLYDKRAAEITKLFSSNKICIITNGDYIREFRECSGIASEIIISVLGGAKGEWTYRDITKNSIEKLQKLLDYASKYYYVSIALTTAYPAQSIEMVSKLDGYFNGKIYLQQMWLPEEPVSQYSVRANWKGLPEYLQTLTKKEIVTSFLIGYQNRECFQIQDSLYIDSDGSITPCCLGPSLLDGSVKWNGWLEYAFNHPELMRMRYLAKNNQPPIPLCLELPNCYWRFIN